MELYAGTDGERPYPHRTATDAAETRAGLGALVVTSTLGDLGTTLALALDDRRSCQRKDCGRVQRAGSLRPRRCELATRLTALGDGGRQRRFTPTCRRSATDRSTRRSTPPMAPATPRPRRGAARAHTTQPATPPTPDGGWFVSVCLRPRSDRRRQSDRQRTAEALSLVTLYDTMGRLFFEPRLRRRCTGASRVGACGGVLTSRQGNRALEQQCRLSALVVTIDTIAPGSVRGAASAAENDARPTVGLCAPARIRTPCVCVSGADAALCSTIRDGDCVLASPTLRHRRMRRRQCYLSRPFQ